MGDIIQQAKRRVLDRIESPRDLLEFKLGAAYKMEEVVLQMLGKLHDKAHSDQLKQQLRHHADETRSQIGRIEQSFSLLGLEPDQKPCPTIEAIDKESRANIKITDERMLDLVILAGAADTEHHEISVYETLITLAMAQGHGEVASLLRDNLEQESHTLEEVKRALRDMIPASATSG
jgi:ferritin-like metal-binding protein YciE